MELSKLNQTLVKKRDTCRLCSSRNQKLVLQLEPTPIGDAYLTEDQLHTTQEVYPLDVFLCLNCGHVQLLDVIDPEALYGDFIYETAISLGLVEHFQKYEEEVSSYLSLPKNSLVVDIGSNDGTLLNFFQKQSMRVLGIDPAREIARKATLAGIETLPRFFDANLAETIKSDRGEAFIVTANNAFANLDNLDDIMEGVRALLHPEGVFIVETGYLVDLVQNGIFDNIYHEHLGYFSVRPLMKFFKRHGMEIIHAQHLPTKGGSIRVMAQLQGQSRRASSDVHKFIEMEKSLSFDQPRPFQQFAQRLKQVRTELTELLGNIKASGKKIAGYGASVGSTTLLYHFHLKPWIDFLIDDNPAKYNTFSPGLHIPTFSPEALRIEKPDYVVILAWRYARPIMRKNTKYLEAGGRFIVPYPEIVHHEQPFELELPGIR